MQADILLGGFKKLAHSKLSQPHSLAIQPNINPLLPIRSSIENNLTGPLARPLSTHRTASSIKSSTITTSASSLLAYSPAPLS